MSFKVIDGGGPGKEERERERDREFAENAFSWAVRDCAANILRIIRGAGRPEDLLSQMAKVIHAADKFHGSHGHLPVDVIANDLRLKDALARWDDLKREGRILEEDINRWMRDGTFEREAAEHRMYRGALQSVASDLICQATQQRSGESEFHEGFRRLEELREERRRLDREAVQIARTAERRPKRSRKKPPRLLGRKAEPPSDKDL